MGQFAPAAAYRTSYYRKGQYEDFFDVMKRFVGVWGAQKAMLKLRNSSAFLPTFRLLTDKTRRKQRLHYYCY